MFLCRLTIGLTVVLLSLTAVRSLRAQTTLENPQPASFQSGIGVVSGWACSAQRIEIVFDSFPPIQAAYGTLRGDTMAVCGDTNNGFGLLVNWNLLGDGTHTVRALADGVEFAQVTITVRTFGTDFLRGASGQFTLEGFPQTGTNAVVRWDQSLQNFVVIDGGPRTPFTAGLASGEVTPSSAVLWTRLDHEGEATVELSSTPIFQDLLLTRTVPITAATDLTAKVEVSPLAPAQTYFYRWRSGTATSAVGTFRTPPTPQAAASVRFVYTGDSDGTPVGGKPFFNNFEVLTAARAESPDFFVYLGDTVYTDSSRRPNRAQTLAEYRAPYKENRAIPALRNLLEFTSAYAIWDDHEVRNDYAGQTVDPLLYANGRQAFLDYMPLTGANLPTDPTCAGAPLFRVVHWGKDVDLIILDERSCRSKDAEDQCSIFGIPAPAPTLPAAYLERFGLPGPPSGCRDAIVSRSRTLLGPVQKDLFTAALLASTAKFKFVINEVPIQQFYLLPYDRWEGYSAEREELLTFIRANHIANVIFLTTDTHATLFNEVFLDRFTDPEPIAYEAIVGPIATFTFEQEIKRIVQDFGLDKVGLDPDTVVDLYQGMFDLAGVDCRHLNTYSYGVVEVGADAGAATITAKDDKGAVVKDQQQASRACSKTLGQ
jgi:phosphodiesterase/alkaline phosphatase D-like protein